VQHYLSIAYGKTFLHRQRIKINTKKIIKKKSETDSAAKGLPITNGNANNKAALSRNAVGESINIYIINSKLYYDDYYYFPSPALLFEPGQISVIRRKSLLLLPIIGIPF